MSMIKNIIFDFGGVIVDLDRENAVRKFEAIGVKDADCLLDKYHQKGIFLQVENGDIDENEFIAELSNICGKKLNYDEVYEGWNAFIINVDRYKLDYLDNLRERGYKVLILSNTNPFVMKWARSSEFTKEGKNINNFADKVYVSYEIKSVKPEKKIFDYLINDSGINPKESLFIDDGFNNITVGKELGFKTIQPENGENWRDKIEKLL